MDGADFMTIQEKHILVRAIGTPLKKLRGSYSFLQRQFDFNSGVNVTLSCILKPFGVIDP